MSKFDITTDVRVRHRDKWMGKEDRGGREEKERHRQDKTRQDYFIVMPPDHNNRVNIHTVSVITESLIR